MKSVRGALFIALVALIAAPQSSAQQAGDPQSPELPSGATIPGRLIRLPNGAIDVVPEPPPARPATQRGAESKGSSLPKSERVETTIAGASARLPRLSQGEEIQLTSACTALATAPSSPATEPEPKLNDSSWASFYTHIKEEAGNGVPDLLFLGDSLVRNWYNGPSQIDEIKRAFPTVPRILFAGIGGDRTGNVIWRIENGNLPAASPAFTVVLIGTNNSDDPNQSGDMIASGVATIVKEVRTRLPGSRVIVISILPRGRDATERRRATIRRADELISRCADNRAVYYLDLAEQFLNPDGTMRSDLASDYLHPSLSGYVIIDDALSHIIQQAINWHSVPNSSNVIIRF